jgi:hypothetical protein
MTKDWRHKFRIDKKKDVQKEFEGWSEQQFIDHILELRDAVVALEVLLEEKGAQTGYKPATKEFSEKDYKQEWSYPTKVAFILTVLQKPLTSAELDLQLKRLDKQYKYYDSPIKNLIVTLHRAVKSGRIKKIKVPGVRTLYYALPEWVNKEGILHEIFNCLINKF